MEKLRQVKTTEELKSIQEACAITKKILKHIPELLVPGITERQVAALIVSRALEIGAEGLAFETIVGFAEHTSRPHHHPTEKKLKKGDLVQIDMGVKVNGYCSDYSRIYFTGPKTAKQTKAENALQKAKKAAEKLVKKGVDVRMLDRTARAVLQTYGFDKEFSHSLGHGLGLDIHEAPTISGKAPKHLLQKNEVITIEPGLYFPGEFGMRIEDTIIVR